MNFLDRFLKSTQISNFIKIRPVGAEFYANRHDEAHSRSLEFFYRASKRKAKSIVADIFLEWFCRLMPGRMDLKNATRTKRIPTVMDLRTSSLQVRYL